VSVSRTSGRKPIRGEDGDPPTGLFLLAAGVSGVEWTWEVPCCPGRKSPLPEIAMVTSNCLGLMAGGWHRFELQAPSALLFAG